MSDDLIPNELNEDTVVPVESAEIAAEDANTGKDTNENTATAVVSPMPAEMAEPDANVTDEPDTDVPAEASEPDADMTAEPVEPDADASVKQLEPDADMTAEPDTDDSAIVESEESINDSDEPQVCKQCGARLPADSAFCPKCGCKLDDQSEEKATEQIEPDGSSTVENQADKKEGSKKPSMGLLLALAIAAIAIFALFNCAGKPNLRDAYNQYCSSVYAEVASDGSYLSIDTNPYDLDGYSDSEAVIAIENVNKALGLPESVLTRMGSTRALDGTQTYSNDKLEVSWTYHPDNGLQVIYSLK